MAGRSIRAALLGPVVIAAGCADGGETGAWRGVVRDSTGIPIVENPSVGLWTGSGAPRVEPELRFGGAAGPPELQFGQIAGVAVAPDGRILVLDRQAREVRVFDPDGVFLRRIGRGGMGPGELSTGVAGLLLLTGDTLLVPDVTQMRINRYAPDGSPLDSAPLPFDDGMPIRFEKLGDGRFLQQTRLLPLPGSGVTEPREMLVVRGSDGAVRDTLMRLPPGRVFRVTDGAAQVRYFDAEPHWALVGGRVAFAMNTDYRIEIHTPDGRVERVITKPHVRQPVTDRDREAILQTTRMMMLRSGAPPPAVEQALQSISFADRYPAFAELLGGPRGTLWVQRVRSAQELAAGPDDEFDVQDIASPTWDVFDDDGRYLGAIELPERFRAFVVVGDHLYGVQRDALDVPSVARLRVVWPEDTD